MPCGNNPLLRACCDRLPRFEATLADYAKHSSAATRPLGMFFSEALALVTAISLARATHFVESGTYEAQSTELVARYFGTSLRIFTNDYHERPGVRERLARWPNLVMSVGDSLELLPRYIASLPRGSRAVVLMDGPKGAPALKLLHRLFDTSPSVVLAALHDFSIEGCASAVGNARANATAHLRSAWPVQCFRDSLHEQLLIDNRTLITTSSLSYRAAFAHLDEGSGLRDGLERQWPSANQRPLLERTLALGPGLWVGARDGASRAAFREAATISSRGALP